MIARIFETPIIDVLLILLAIRFIWPSLFGIKPRRKKEKMGATTFRKGDFTSMSSKKTSDKVGEYIDYEEIK